VIKKLLVTAGLTVAMAGGLTVPATQAGAAANSSGLANCERAAAVRYANRLANGGDRSTAKRKFDNDIARCKRRFG
jgi:hypothetical protein